MKSTCDWCGTGYTRNTPIQKYCSAKCRQAYKNRPKGTCAICHEPMHSAATSAPEGEAAHRACKPEVHGVGRYGHGCRCEVCTEANTEAAREYRVRTNYYSLPEVRAKRREYRTTPEYRAKYRAGERIREARREAALREAPTTKFSADDLAARLSMFAGCWICGDDISDEMHVDHVKPLSKGGPHMLSNLRPACPECNIRKGAQWPFAA